MGLQWHVVFSPQNHNFSEGLFGSAKGLVCKPCHCICWRRVAKKHLSPIQVVQPCPCTQTPGHLDPVVHQTTDGKMDAQMLHAHTHREINGVPPVSEESARSLFLCIFLIKVDEQRPSALSPAYRAVWGLQSVTEGTWKVQYGHYDLCHGRDSDECIEWMYWRMQKIWHWKEHECWDWLPKI